MKAGPLPGSPFHTEAHEAFRAMIRRFLGREFEPFADERDEAGEFPAGMGRTRCTEGSCLH